MNFKKLLKKIYYFSGFSDTELDILSQRCGTAVYRAGEVICKAGDEWNALYFILEGEIEIINEKSSKPILIDTLYEGASFGEDFIHKAIPIKFSYYSHSAKTSVLKLDKSSLDVFLKDNPKCENRIIDSILARSLKQLFSRGRITAELSEKHIVQFQESIQRVNIPASEKITDEAGKQEKIFIVYQGRLKELKSGHSETGLKYFYGGMVIGELSKGMGEPVSGTIVADTECSILVIPKIELMLVLLEQKEFESSLDKIINETIARQKVDEKAEEEKPEEEKAREKGPEFKFRTPLKYRFGLFPTYRQHSAMDCGAACLVMICKYFKKNVSLNQMRDMAKVGREGASMFYLLKALENLGFIVDPMLSTYDHIMSTKLPAIVNWRGYHWIVVFKVTPDKVIVGDPGGGLKKYTRAEFEEGWTRYSLFVTPTEEIKNIEETKPTLNQFKGYFAPFKKYIREIFLASICVQIINVIYPLFTKFIVDKVIVKQDQQLWLIGIIAIIASTLLIALLNYIRQKLILFVSLRANIKMIADFFKQVMSLPLPFFEARKIGDITTRFMENEKITNFMTQTGMQIFLDLLTAILYFIMMFFFNTTLTFVISFFLLMQIIIFYVLTPLLRQVYREVFQLNSNSDSFLIESLKGIGTIKTLGIENSTRWKWENLQIKFINGYFKTIKYGIVSSLANGLINNMSDVAILFVGAYFVLQNKLTIGELVAFQLMTKSISAPVMSMLTSWTTFQEALNSVERLNDVLESKAETTAADEFEKTKLPGIRGFIKFEDVTFRYAADSKNNILQNITFEVKPGQKVAFVGRSGSGKSTMIKLIYGFYKPSSGKIYIDGFDISSLYLPELRGKIGMVPQENDLFRGTIRENISKGKPDSQLADIIEAAKLARAHDFISGFPKGYDTFIEEKGANLSGGQRQRIAIARTFLLKPKILVLDEATSSLDNETERKIQNNINTAFKGNTIIMIAHRLSTVQDADLIVVVDRGNIIEFGNHNELLSQRGLYYYLANQQLSL